MEALILMHGALGTKEDMDVIASALKKENYNVYSFSFSGHGHLYFEDEFGIEQFSAELEAFIVKEKLVKPSVIGYSMGGYVALYLALRSPGSLNKIICHATKFNWAKEVVEKETRNLNPEILLQKMPSFAKALETKHGVNWTRLLEKTAQMMHEINRENYLNVENLKTIENSILLGLGDKDQMVSLEETINVYKQLPNASMYIIPNTKHPLETINPDVFMALINGFLKK